MTRDDTAPGLAALAVAALLAGIASAATPPDPLTGEHPGSIAYLLAVVAACAWYIARREGRQLHR